MKRSRRVFGGEFRAKVALAAVKGDKTLSELAGHFKVHFDPGVGLAEGTDRSGGGTVRGWPQAEGSRRGGGRRRGTVRADRPTEDGSRVAEKKDKKRSCHAAPSSCHDLYPETVLQQLLARFPPTISIGSPGRAT